MVDPSVDVWWVGRSMNPTAQKEAGSRRTTQNIKTIRNIVACFLVQPVNIYIYSYFIPIIQWPFQVPKLEAPAICKGVVPHSKVRFPWWSQAAALERRCGWNLRMSGP